MPKEILKCNFGMGTGKKGSEMLRAKTEGVKEYRKVVVVHDVCDATKRGGLFTINLDGGNPLHFQTSWISSAMIRWLRPDWTVWCCQCDRVGAIRCQSKCWKCSCEEIACVELCQFGSVPMRCLWQTKQNIILKKMTKKLALLWRWLLLPPADFPPDFWSGWEWLLPGWCLWSSWKWSENNSEDYIITFHFLIVYLVNEFLEELNANFQIVVIGGLEETELIRLLIADLHNENF